MTSSLKQLEEQLEALPNSITHEFECSDKYGDYLYIITASKLSFAKPGFLSEGVNISSLSVAKYQKVPVKFFQIKKGLKRCWSFSSFANGLGSHAVTLYIDHIVDKAYRSGKKFSPMIHENVFEPITAKINKLGYTK